MALRIDEWLTTYNTGDPMHDTAVAQVALAQALGDAAREGRAQLQDTTAKIKEINQLSDLLRSKRTTSTNPSDYGLEITPDEQAKIITLMTLYCPNIDTSQVSTGKLQQANVDQWLNSLSGASQDFSSQASKLNAELQSKVSGFEAAMQGGSGLIKKNEQLGDSVSNNLRS